MTCRLIVVLPSKETLKSRFRRWRSERTNGATVTVSLGFESEDDAMTIGKTLPYVWNVESEWLSSR